MASAAASLVAWIGAVARARSNSPALIESGSVISYRELWDRSAAVARELLMEGLRPGDAVGIIGANEAAYVVNYLGIVRAGATAVPVSNLLDGQAVKNQLSFVNVQSVFLGKVEPDVRDAVAGAFRVRPMRQGAMTASSARLPNMGPDSPCSVLLTSGSTGQPKGVIHTQGSMLHAALQLASAFPFSADDRGLVFLPLYACIPEQVLPTLCSGGSLEILPGFDIERVADACDRVTTFDAVPTVLSRLIEHVSPDKLAQLTWILFASEPMPVPLLERWWAEVPTVELHQFYGMTEVLTLTAAPDRLLRRDPTTVGYPFATTALTIDEDPTRSDGSGEVCGLTPARMKGYFENPEATNAVIAGDGAMRTGDLGRLDDCGLLYLTGRKKDIIISGGINISPAEIETVACHHPAVERAIVVGVPSSRWGETPVVLAVARPGAQLSAGDLLDHCRSHLSGYKRPTAAGVVESLPTTGIGKTAKDAVRSKILNGEINVVRIG